MSVFALMLLTMLLGMVMNVGRQVDGKIRMQNSADAAAYSGGVVLARGMNTLSFTNHLLCDVFAMTAFLRDVTELEALRGRLQERVLTALPFLVRHGDNLAPAIVDAADPFSIDHGVVEL